MNQQSPKNRPRNKKKGRPRPPQSQVGGSKSQASKGQTDKGQSRKSRSSQGPQPQKSSLQSSLTNQEREQMVRRAKARSDLYEIYSLLFQEVPSQDLLAVFRHSDFLSIIELLLTPEILTRWKKFASSKTPLDHVQHRLRLEYNSLFLLPTSQRIALRESAFFLQKGKSQAGHKRVDSLLKYYRRIGLNPMAKYKDQPDHLSQVMHFMSVLCEREKDHLQKKNDAQLESICQIQELFLARHLAEWIPLFKERMHRATRFIFYREIADTLEALLNSENAWVPGLLERYGLTRSKKSQDRPREQKHARKAGASHERPSEKKGPVAQEKNEASPKGGEEDRRKPRRRRRRRRPRTPGEGAPKPSPAA